MMLHQYSSLLVRGCFSCCKNVSIASSILTKAISTSCHLSIRGSRLGKGELPEDYGEFKTMYVLAQISLLDTVE